MNTEKIKIRAENIGKSFNNRWLFENIELSLNANESIAILGANGVGKSTFTLILAGQIVPTTGIIQWCTGDNPIELNQLNSFYALASPGMELPEELNFKETIGLYYCCKKSKHDYKELLDLFLNNFQFKKRELNKEISQFSSGMKQKLKLLLSFYADTPVIFLDEPLTNLDNKGIELYNKLIDENISKRTIIIASNRVEEYKFCKRQLFLGA